MSEGCDNCYAVGMTKRLEAMGLTDKYGGLVNEGKQHFNGVVKTHDDELLRPLDRRKPTTYFVNSMSDLFHEGVPFEFIDKVFATMALCKQHTFQILTKRPERMLAYLDRLSKYNTPLTAARVMTELELLGEVIDGTKIMPDSQACSKAAFSILTSENWPLRNVWLGTSVENQKTADERIPYLLKCEAAVRFLSCEPLLGSIDFKTSGSHGGGLTTTTNYLTGWVSDWNANGPVYDLGTAYESKIDWVIAGGESGPKARPMHPSWVESIKNQCVSAKVPFFFKQWGTWGTQTHNMGTGEPVFRSFHSFQEWVNKAESRVRGGTCVDMGGNVLSIGADFINAREKGLFPVAILDRIGKKNAGRLLDGQEWSQMPKPKAC